MMPTKLQFLPHNCRFPDTGTRVAWQEALTNTIVQHKFSGNSLAGSRRAWVNTAIEGESAHKGRGVLASAQSDDPSSEEGSKANTPTARNGGGGFGSFADGSGTSHLHRLLRLRTERAMASITGGPTTSDPRGSGQRASSSPTAEARAGRPVKPEVKVIINAQRGSSGSPSQPSGSGNDSGKQSSARGVKYKY